MTEPHIVYCPNHHIYDASLYSECPYCRKIAENQSTLEEAVGDRQRFCTADGAGEGDAPTEYFYSGEMGVDHRSEMADDDAATEYIDRTDGEDEAHLPPGAEDEDGATEYIDRTGGEDEAHLPPDAEEGGGATEYIDRTDGEDEAGFPPDAEEVNGATEYIDRTGGEDGKMPGGAVLGWLVCGDGAAAGRSFEITAGVNFLHLDQGRCRVSCGESSRNAAAAEIIYADRRFRLIPGAAAGCRVNGRQTGPAELRSYDVIEFDGVRFVFVEFAAAFMGWGT